MQVLLTSGNRFIYLVQGTAALIFSGNTLSRGHHVYRHADLQYVLDFYSTGSTFSSSLLLFAGHLTLARQPLEFEIPTSANE